MGKILWLDTETTGLYSKENAVIEIAAIIEVDDVVQDEFTIKMQPHEGAKIEARALEVNGRTETEIEKFQTVKKGIAEFKSKLSDWVNKFDPKDKLVPAGYNIKFDLEFIREAFSQAGDKYGIGSWCFNSPIDVWSYVGRLISQNGLRLANYKLATLCEHFEIEIDAHNPVSDITATRELFHIIEKELYEKRT